MSPRETAARPDKGTKAPTALGKVVVAVAMRSPVAALTFCRVAGSCGGLDNSQFQEHTRSEPA
jgi:hypothetical protein